MNCVHTKVFASVEQRIEHAVHFGSVSSETCAPAFPFTNHCLQVKFSKLEETNWVNVFYQTQKLVYYSLLHCWVKVTKLNFTIKEDLLVDVVKWLMVYYI